MSNRIYLKTSFRGAKRRGNLYQSRLPRSFQSLAMTNQFETGQSLLEVVIAMTVGILVVTALVFATIFSLRNAQFAKTSAQATKLAQEGLERVRILRDRDGRIDYTRGDGSLTSKFSDLWLLTFACPTNCYFYFNTSEILTGYSADRFESVPPNFQRQFQIENNGTDQKKVTVIVKWTDFAGPHESRLTTILRKL